MEWKKLLSNKRRGHTSPKNTADLRTEFQRDYHRILGSASFRRLQDKTQVFPLDRGDFVRTRLTHSLEVASFAKSLAQMCFTYIEENSLDSSVDYTVRDAACSILECAGLLHDIGNPPFGHFGETAIRAWFRSRLSCYTLRNTPVTELLTPQMLGDLYNFEGNAQALRLVSKLHSLVDDNGMHLTYAALNTIIKYPVSSLGINKNSGNIKDKKMGYFFAEEELFKDITDTTGAKNNRYPLTFLLEAADDIAYKTADIEDAVKKGLLSYGILLTELKGEYCRGKCSDDSELKAYDRLVSRLETLLARAVERGVPEPELNAVQNWIISVQGTLLRGAQKGFTDNYAAIMDGSFECDILSASGMNAISVALSDIAYRYAFRSSQILRLEITEETIINSLLDKLVPAAILYDTEYPLTAVQERMMDVASDNYKYIYKVYSAGKSETEKLYLRLLLVTDCICGMTDGYARDIYREFNGIN